MSHLSEKYEFVSWDDDIPYTIYIYGKIKAMFQTTNQNIIRHPWPGKNVGEVQRIPKGTLRVAREIFQLEDTQKAAVDMGH